jgi:hypothetical protein
MRFASRVLFLVAILGCGTGIAQQKINPATGINWPVITGTVPPVSPTVPCAAANIGQPYAISTTGVGYTCTTGGWVLNVSSVTAGVASLNSFAGALTLAGSSTVTVTPSGGNTLTLTASSGTTLPANLTGVATNGSGAAIQQTQLVPHLSLGYWVFGDSYDQTFGATVGGESYVQLVADSTPAPEFQFAVGGTTEPVIANSTLANFTPDTTFSSTVMTNGGNNDYTQDTCGHVSPSPCITNYSNQLTAAIGWTAFPTQDRILASNGTVGTGCTANSTTVLNPINGNVAGTAESCTTAGSGITWSIPATNAGLVAVVTTNTNGAAGTYSISIDGVLQVDNCTETTTYGIGGCQGTAQNNSPAPQSQLLAVTPGAAHTIVAVPLTANPVIFIAAEWAPATHPTNQNATFVNNSGAQFDINGIYSAQSLVVVNAFEVAGLPVFPVNIRAALLALPGGGVGGATATTPGTTFANHPNNGGQFAEYQAMLAEEQTAGYVFTSQGLGAKYTAGDGQMFTPFTLFLTQLSTPGAATFQNLFANFNGNARTGINPSAGATQIGWLDFENSAGNSASGWRMGSGAVLGATGNFFKHSTFGTTSATPANAIDYFCGEALNTPAAPEPDASYAVGWCMNSRSGLSYTAGNISSTKSLDVATAFTVVTGSSCGTLALASTNGPSAGTLTTTATTCSIGFNLPTAPTGWACFLRDLTTPADALNPTATTVSTATFSGTVVPGDTLQLTCPQGY